MTLKVIGAGFGRTGTLSLKLALEQFGFGPCYHMAEVRGHPDHIALWRRAWGGEDVWPQLFEGYAAAVDWPAAAFWQRLMAYYPNAKVVLSLRDGESWFKSASDTIFRGVREGLASAASGEGPADEHLAMVKEIIVDGTFDGDLTDAEAAVATFDANVAAVREAVPASRLIEADARDGWEPLCAGLGVPVPGARYPKVNTTEEFAQRWGRRRESS